MFKIDAILNDKSKENTRVIIQTKNMYPEQFRKFFYKNARAISPQQTGWLKRSIRSQITGNEVIISWAARYARAVNDGQHTVRRPVRGINPNTGLYSTISPGVYQHKTGSKGFADRIHQQAIRDMRAWTESRGFK